MGYTQRQDARSHDSITTFDSPTLGPATYTASATLGCNNELVALLLAIKGAGPFVQGAAAASASGGSATIAKAFHSNNTAGNCIIVDTSMSGLFGPGATTAVCTDTQGNIYTQVSAAAVGGGNLVAFSFIAFGVLAGANTVTVTFTPGFSDAPGPVTIAINEYTGGAAFDAAGVAAGALGPVFNMAVGTTAAGDLLHLVVFIAPTCAGSPFNVDGGIPAGWLIINEPSLGYTDRTPYLYKGADRSHTFTLQLRQRGQATIHLNVPAGDPYQPTQWSPIYLFDQTQAGGYQLVFAGVIEDLENHYYTNAGDHFVVITAVTFEAILDTVYVDQTAQYVNQTCGAILTDLFNRFEFGSQITLGSISAGPAIPLFTPDFASTKLSDIFDQLATTAAFTWSINPSTQTLFFGPPSLNPAPFTITSQTIIWDQTAQIIWKTSGRDQRLRQAVKLSYNAFSHSCEYYVGNGQLTFTLLRPLEQVTNAYVTTATPSSAVGSFSGNPSPGDTVTIGPAGEVWQANHIYGIGGIIIFDGFVFQVTTAGTSGGSVPNFAAGLVTGDTVGDNSVIWTNQGPLGLGTGNQTYTFVAALDNTQFGQVLIASAAGQTCQNFVDALLATASRRGIGFSLPTWENIRVNAIYTSSGATSFTIQEKTVGASPRSQLSTTSSAFSWSTANTSGGTSPQTSVGPNEPAWLSIAVYQSGTSTAAPGLAYVPGAQTVQLATPLNSGTHLIVEYTRQDGDIIQVENSALVAQLALVSHGTGKLQQSTDQSNLGLISTSADAGLQLAQEILAAYEVAPDELNWNTFIPGLLPGQSPVVSLASPLIAGPAPVLNGVWVIESIQVELVTVLSTGQSPWLLGPNFGHYKYTIKAVNIQEIDSWMDFWKGLGGGGSSGGAVGGLVATSGGAGGSGATGTGPGGTSPQVQFNAGAALGGITGATSDGTSLMVTTQAQYDNSTKAASTAYTDLAVANAIAGVNPAIAVQAATTSAANTSGLTYNNGVSGVGATFTGTANTALTVDGFTFTTLGQRLLVKNDTQSPSGAFNGIYYVTQVQTLLLPPILTRALDYDQPSDINNTGAIPVVNGTVNATTSWLLTSAVATVGTDPLTYVQFSANPSTLVVNPMTTRGDVIVAATSGVPARLAVGTNGQVLTASSAATNGLDYEAPIALTTTGTSGAASLTPGNPYVLNVPQYSGGGGGGSISAGTFAALPGSPTSGQLYLFTNSIYDQAIFQSSAWVYLKGGQQLTPPVDSSFTWQNQSTATDTTANGGMNLLSAVGAAAANVNGRYIAYPTPPFTRTFAGRIRTTGALTSAFVGTSGGIYLSDGTKVLIFGVAPLGVNTGGLSGVPQIIYQSGPNMTTINTNVFGARPCSPSDMYWIRMDDGVTSAGHRTFFLSYDGVVFTQIYQETNATFLTPTRIGVYAGAYDSGSYAEVWAAHWQ